MAFLIESDAFVFIRDDTTVSDKRTGPRPSPALRSAADPRYAA